MALFGGALAAVSAIAARYETAAVNEVISLSEDTPDPTNPATVAHYHHIGRNALELILQAMLIANKVSVKTILDMACGYGRVARHLEAAFPEAALSVCDLWEDRIAFCAKEFRCTPILSKHNLSELSFPEPFDLIWSGSLLTHLPEQQFLDALKLFSRSLAPDGIAVVTSIGRFAPWFHHTNFKYVSDEMFVVAERGFYKDGFGYVDYGDPLSTSGITLSSATFIVNAMEEDHSIRIMSFTECGWDRHQDVLVFQKSPIFSYTYPLSEK